MKKTIALAMALVFSLSGLSAFAERINDPLVANDFTKSTPKNTTLQFSAADFTSSVNPPEGGALVSVTITQLTNGKAGTLRLGTEAIAKNAEIKTADLGRLNFVPAKDYTGEAIFTWNASYGSSSSPYPSAVVITIGDGAATASQPPAEDTTEPPSASPTPTDTPAAEPTDTPAETPPAETPSASPQPTEAPAPTQKPLQYEDMLTHWGAYAAGMLGAEGIIVGEEIGGHFYFYPDKVLTRIDFIILANSIFGIKTKDSLEGNPFADTDVPSYMLRQAIAAYENGLIAGSPEAGGLYLRPFDRLTRAEAVKILDNGLKLLYPARDDLDFADSDQIPGWARDAVRNMEAYGIIRGYDDNTFRPYESINKAQAGEMLYQVFKYREKVRKTQSVFNEIFYGTR
ncbi:MAG: hypothetical protein E7414_00020 [Ruminococcaceae bacterium]|nr:hypothetical protein [Oscillospiraceae bacterium]